MSPNGVSTGNDNGYLPISTEQANSTETKESITSKEVDVTSEKQENESTSTTSDEQSDNGIIVPPDGGWGWVIVLSSFVCNMIVDGITFAFGMFLDDIANTFQVSTAYVSVVGSLLAGFYLMVGPFTSALANRYGFQLVAISGSILAAIAFGLSYFANSIMFLCITYGVLGGIGFGFIYVPAVITVGFYFEKWRALATGIGVCGSGIGTFVFAPICAALIKHLGWRLAFVVQGAIVLICIIFGATFKPLKPTKIKELKKKEELEEPELIMDSSKLNPVTKMKMENALQDMKSNSTHLLNESQSAIPAVAVNNNPENSTTHETSHDKVYHTITVPQHQRIAQIYSQEKRTIPIFANEDDEKSTENSNGTAPLLEEQSNHTSPITVNNRRHTVSERRTRTTSENEHHRHRKGNALDINRPLYRDDIFFSASLTRLPQYTSQTSLAYNLSVTHPPTRKDVDEERKKECRCCPESVKRALATMLDLNLLKSLSFMILAISGALTMMGFYVPFVYMKDRATISGMDTDKAVWLISAIGIANTIGRVVSGLFSSMPEVNVLLVNNIALSIGGISTMLSSLSMSEEYQFTYAAIFGLSISCFASLRPILVVELVGLERLTNAFGLLLLFQGVATCVGSPMAGQFFKTTGSYSASFYLSGSLILASAVICYPLNMINRWEKRRAGELERPSVAI